MRQLFSNTEQEEEANIDITPMLDVVFIMLIFFIVTKDDSSAALLPQPTPNNKAPATTTTEMDRRLMVNQCRLINMKIL